jgi:tetratricopeptide (TPR) repeat protein
MVEASAPSMGRVFISYRREETAYPAGWLYDRLADRYGGQVFKDVDSIQLGDDFVEVITRAVASCDVLLALIGDEWLTITDTQQRRRLDDPGDFVRLEIEAALTRNVRVIPILVDGARIPHADDLPPSLAGLVRRQALELSPARFDFDTSRLLKVLDRTLAEVRSEQDSAAASARAAKAPEQSATPRHPAQAYGSDVSSAESAPVVELYDDPEYTAALAAYFTERWDTAVDLLTRVLTRYPDHPQVIERLGGATRQQQLAGWDAEAREAAEHGRWAAAVEALEHITATEPDRPDIAGRLEHARTQQKVTDLQADLRRMHAAGEWTAVIAISEQLAELDPSLLDPDGLVATAQTGLAEAALAERYSTGLRQMDRGDLAAAAETFAAILDERPGYRDAPALLARARERPPAPETSAVSSPAAPRSSSEASTEPPAVAASRPSVEPPQPEAVQAPDEVEGGASQSLEQRRLRLGAGLAILGAVMIIAGSFLPFIWDSPITEYYMTGWYAYALVVAALVAGASVHALTVGAWSLTSTGILLGTAAASAWGVAVPVSQLKYEGFGVGFLFVLAGDLALVLAAVISVRALRRRMEVRLAPRALHGALAWLVALFGVGGAVALLFFGAEIVRDYDGVDYWLPPAVLTIMALVVPVSAAIAIPRRFGVAMLAGWIVAAASVFVVYGVLAYWDIAGSLFAFGVTLLGLAVVAVPFARADNAQAKQRDA